MEDNIKLKKEKKTGFMNVAEYHGYGQILKIMNDGEEKHIILRPEDPMFGVTIFNIESGNPNFNIPPFHEGDANIVLENLGKAREFCREFFERREEFL